MWIPPAHSPVSARTLLSALPEGKRAVRRFEAQLAERFQRETAIFTESGTQALQLALTLALEGLPASRRRVAVPGFGCYDVMTAAVGAGAPVMFYDVSPEHLGPETESLEQSASSCGVLVAADLYGFPLDWSRLTAVAREAGAVLIEDAAQGIGSDWEGRVAGTHGDLAVLSFGRGKGWTGGGGGALLIRRRGQFSAPRVAPGGKHAPRSACLPDRHLPGADSRWGPPRERSATGAGHGTARRRPAGALEPSWTVPRTRSASPAENPAATMAICITCSWNIGTPSVRSSTRSTSGLG